VYNVFKQLKSQHAEVLVPTYVAGLTELYEAALEVSAPGAVAAGGMKKGRHRGDAWDHVSAVATKIAALFPGESAVQS
jgi:hypothetical protein